MGTFEEFKQSIINKERHFKVQNSWGVYDYFKYYRRTKPAGSKWVLTDGQFYRLFRGVNKLLAQELEKTGHLSLPYNMGELFVLQKKTRSFIVNGKVRTNRYVDWDETLKLWYEDDDARKRKCLIYKDVPQKSVIKFSKKAAMFSNKSYYEFTINRFLRNRCFQKTSSQLLCVDNEIKGLYDG